MVRSEIKSVAGRRAEAPFDFARAARRSRKQVRGILFAVAWACVRPGLADEFPEAPGPWNPESIPPIHTSVRTYRTQLS